MHQWTPLIVAHAIAASYALLFGAFNLIRRKRGDALHRLLGFVWVGCMYFVSVSSFWIQTIEPGQFSLLHALSAFTVLTVSLGLVAAVRRNRHAHKRFMAGSYLGLLGAFVGVVAVPSRLIPQLAVHDLFRFAVISAFLVGTAALFVSGCVAVRRQTKQSSS